MKKVFLTWMAILAAIITVNAQVNVWDGSHEAWTNGSGTKDDPYLIESAAHLAHLAYLVKRDMIFVNTGWTTDEKNHTFGTGIYYKLTTDIDLNGLEWIPIGCRQNTAQYWTYYVCHFGGHFDGNGHTVANLSIRTSDIESSGLFGHVRGATVQNLGITGNDSIIAGNAGAIAGYCAGNTTITNCYNTIYISTGGASGGIVGINNGVLTIINCYNKGMVNNGYAGGIIGETRNMSELNIVNCYNTAPITTKRGASGGIIGNVYRIANVVNCYNTGTVVNAIGGGTNVNCYVLAGCAKNRPSEVQELTETVMKSPEFGRMLKYYFVQDVEPYQNEGYPVHSHLLLETLEVSDITETSVTLNAMFDPGNNPVPAIQKGFQYKTFRVDDSLWINLVVNTDAFSYNLTGLASGKAYHFKPFIVMEPGDTIYGAERSFATIHNGSRAIWDGSAMPVTPDGDTYYIYYPDELAWIAQQCNSGYNFAGKNVMLMNDLDLNGNETLQWTPIGHSARFAGNFEGNNHTVHNLYITNGENLLGLFGSTNGATIRNLSLANGVIISTSAHTGAIVGWVLDTTTITNCHNALYISTGGASGGIVGKCDGVITIINCYNKGKINGTVAGGIIGEITGMNTSNISNCYNIATIVASSGTAANKIGGGIVGTSAINVNVINCYNTGTADNAIIASGGGKYTNCYILESSAKYIPFEVLALTETVMKSSEFVEMLGYAFVQDTEPYQNAGYPVHSGFLLETLEGSNITDTSVTLNAAFEPGNTVSAIQKGFQYKTFTTDDYIFTNLPADAAVFSYNLTDLTSGRSYCFKPFVVTVAGDTIYGIERYFTTMHNGSREIWDGSIMPVTPDGDTYYIYYPDELAWVAQQCNSGYNFAGKNVVLMNDLDLNGSELVQWTPIGYGGRECDLARLYNYTSQSCRYPFAGNFEGNHHTVYNMYINKDADYLGIFGSTDGATINNLSLANGCIIAVTAATGTIVGWPSNNTLITNCHNSIDISGSGFLGGIIGTTGYYGARIERCSNSGNISSGIAGGIVGWLYNGSVIDCRNSGTINGSNVGGIAGEISKGEISGCYNTGNIFGSFPSYHTNGTGGIVGTTAYGSDGPMIITDCHNTGTLTNTSGGTIAIGGILGNDVGGMPSSSTITHCSNAGNILVDGIIDNSITGSNYVLCGGIVGNWGTGSYSDFPIANCYNTGNILVSGDDITRNEAGGIVGGAMSMNAPIINCYNTGNISVSGNMVYNYIGGIIGLDLVGYTEFINCYNAGSISYSGTSTFWGLGGINGDNYTYTSSINSYYLETCGGGLIGIPKPDSEMKTSEFVDLLNSGVIAYRQDTIPFINKGYPVLYTFEQEAIKTFAATSITQSKATFNGYLNPVFPMTVRGFSYKAASDAAYTFVEVTGDSDTLAYQVTGLIAGTSYQYRTFGVYQNDTIYALNQPFTTLPISLTFSVDDVSTTEATLTGGINAGDAILSSAHIEYRQLENGPFEGWWDIDTIPWINAGENLQLTVHLTGLSPRRYYECRLVVVNGSNTYYSGESFVTHPVATTLPATNITQTTATLNATATPGYGDIEGYFEYKLATNENYEIMYDEAKRIFVTDTFSHVTGTFYWEYPLLPGKEYHYRVIVNGIYGQVETFTTLPVNVDSIRLEQTSLTLLSNNTVQLRYNIYPSDATNQNVVWTSDNPTVATVSQAGLVTAQQSGTATITVTTEDGSKTATCEVTVPRSNDATLRDLTVSAGTLSPAFAPTVTNYTINVPNEVTSITVIGTANHTAATVNGNITGKPLDVGDNVVDITVTAEDGTTELTYTVTIRRMSNDATLSSLTVSSGILSFDANTTNYTVNVANEITSINITGSANHSAATVNGNVTDKPLEVGNNVITITVIAEDDTTEMTYTVTVVRAASSDATLSGLTVSSGTLSPSFNANTTGYTVEVPNEITSINVTGTANHAIATVNGNVTDKTLEVGDNVMNIIVTAEDGTTELTYTVTIRRMSNDATLSNLTVSIGTLSFNANTTSYTVNVANEVTSITVTGIANHDLARVNGNVTDKTLEVNDNVVNITVTAEDGTTLTYTVTIHRVSNDATLRDLTVSSGILLFDANITDYTVNVSNEITSINVTGTANYDLATVSGNVTGRTLEVGDNVVDITVTAEDGTVKTYTVTVIRSDHVFGVEANLVNVTTDGKLVSVTGNNIEYAADCDENSLALDLQASPYSTITLNGAAYTTGQSINFAGGDTTVNIRVTAETGEAKNNYTLKITAPIDESKLYYQRWNDVIAINRNPATNGGYNVSEIRWNNPDGTVINSGYVMIEEGKNVSDYQAEIRVGSESEWRRVCNVSETRSIEKIIAYPNPVPRGESVQLQLPEAFVGGVLNIYDIKGTLIKSGVPLPATSVSVNVSDLDSGIYLLHVAGKNGDYQVIKVIIGG